MLRNRTVYYYSCFFGDHVSCNYPSIWNSKNSLWVRKSSWHIFKYCPGIRLVVERKSKKILCLFESLWQWLIHCVDVMLGIWCNPALHLLLRNRFYSCRHVTCCISVHLWQWLGLRAPIAITTVSTKIEKKKNSKTNIEFHATTEWSRDVPRLTTFFFRRLGLKSTLL